MYYVYMSHFFIMVENNNCKNTNFSCVGIGGVKCKTRKCI